MIDLTSPDTVEEAYAGISSQYRGTPFEEFVDIYKKHENVVRFFVESSDEFTPDAYLGSYESFLDEGINIDDEKLIEAIESSEYVDMMDFLSLGSDIAEFYHTVISEHTETWADVTNLFASVSDVSPEEIDESFREHQQEIIEGIESLASETEDEEELEVINNMKEEVRNKNLRSMLLESFAMQSEISAMGLDLFTYGDMEVEIGDYFVYTAKPHQKHLEHADEYDVEFTEETEFNIIGKIISDREVEEDVGTQIEYKFNLLAYDSDIKELYPEFWMFQENARIKPEHSSDLELYTDSPVGDIPSRVN